MFKMLSTQELGQILLSNLEEGKRLLLEQACGMAIEVSRAKKNSHMELFFRRLQFRLELEFQKINDPITLVHYFKNEIEDMFEKIQEVNGDFERLV